MARSKMGLSFMVVSNGDQVKPPSRDPNVWKDDWCL